LDLDKDLKCATEVVSTIQAYLDTRAAALPRLAKQRRETREKPRLAESEDSYSFGMQFTDGDLLALGGEVVQEDPVQKADEEVGKVSGDSRWLLKGRSSPLRSHLIYIVYYRICSLLLRMRLC
jgi:hypothetical protein